MRAANMSWIAIALAVGCGGDGGKDGDSGAACGQIDLQISVADPSGNPLEGATVTVDNEFDCTDAGGGSYDCSVPGPGEYNLYVTFPPEWAPWGSQITADCTANPMAMDVTLNFENGGL